MDIERNEANDLGNEKPYRVTGHDEDSASYLKPIIKELVRTQVCFPNIKLLVDKISTVDVPSESSDLKAYRMYLTDREKTIQAVVKRRLHKWLTTFDVREGSYVILKEYDLARGKRLHGDGDVLYLAISDFYSIGEEQRYNSSTERSYVSASAEGNSGGPLDQAYAMYKDESNELDIVRTERSLPGESSTKAHQDMNVGENPLSWKSAMTEPKRRKREATSLDSSSDLPSQARTADKSGESPSAKIARVNRHNDAKSRSSDSQFSSPPYPNIPLPQQSSSGTWRSPERAASPLQLSTLASVTGTNATRNRQVNILAMIEHVNNSTVKPTTAPLKRDVRIIDPSTERKVTLSVFVDPVNFVPKKYDIILFRNLTTHNFGGGSLNVYPKKCKGKDWYTLNPYDIEECDMKSMESFREEYRKNFGNEKYNGPNDRS